MKCEHSEHLIPLYVGGDLEPPEAETLRQHLDACVNCRQLHEEFAASHTWLSEFAAPDFEAPTYADLRASVIRKIEQQEKRGSWFQWLLPKWNPRLMLAASAASLAIVTGLIAVTYYRQQTPVTGGSDTLANGGKLITPEAGSRTFRPKIREEKQIKPVKTTRTERPRSGEPAEIPLPPEAFQNDPFAAPSEEPVTTSDLAEATPAEPEEREMLRIELQTADPNIRIIWLTPKAAPTEPNIK
jgi:hypothetical protein